LRNPAMIEISTAENYGGYARDPRDVASEAGPDSARLNQGAVSSKQPPETTWFDALIYWVGLPLRWGYQMAHNGLGILQVLDIIRFRPLPSGLIGPDHPWVTGLNPQTGRSIWHDNVLYRSACARDQTLPSDLDVINTTCRFLAKRVALSSRVPEIPLGPRRRMPHGINYIHGTSHYNSGILVFTDFKDALTHFTYRPFREEIWRFVRNEKREVLIIFRQKQYQPRELAYFSCCLRTLFPWFCNANGPQDCVLWGNHAPFPVTNLITGYWARDVYALRTGSPMAGTQAPVPAGKYFRNGPYALGRDHYRWPERLLALATHWRVRLRGARGGMFFVDRRKAYADRISARRRQGLEDVPVARI
jgi:hypothetical protein